MPLNKICSIAKMLISLGLRSDVFLAKDSTETGDKAIGNAQVGSSLPTAIQDKDLMPGERRFRNDGTKPTWF